jgi:hypothetical protein
MAEVDALLDRLAEEREQAEAEDARRPDEGDQGAPPTLGHTGGP